MIVLIPAYEPTRTLPELISDLGRDITTVIVDDGSGPSFLPVFEQARELGAEVVHLPRNQGKGAALKAGFAYARRHYPGRAVVTADSDGQHRPADIMAVAAAIRPGAISLGVRNFGSASIHQDPERESERPPLRSRIGNQVSATVFRSLCGVDLADTQTGLRGYPPDLLVWLGEVPGTRFEYEFEMLFAAARSGIELPQVPIATIYLDHNEGSHFRPLADSWRVYRPVLAFVGSSMASFVVDALVLFVLFALTQNLLFAMSAARLTSAGLNYRLNRTKVFVNPDGTEPGSLRRYVALALGIGAANFALLWTLVDVLSVPLVPAKVLTEIALYLVSFAAQQRLVFAGRIRAERPDPRPSAFEGTSAEPHSKFSVSSRKPTDTSESATSTDRVKV